MYLFSIINSEHPPDMALEKPSDNTVISCRDMMAEEMSDSMTTSSCQVRMPHYMKCIDISVIEGAFE